MALKRTTAVLALLGLAAGLGLVAAPASAAGTHTISGQVLLPGSASANWLQGISVTADGPATATVPVSIIDGTFTIPDLPDGDYTLKAFGTPFTLAGNPVIPNVITEYSGDSHTAAGASKVTVADANVTDQVLHLDRGGILRGEIQLPDGSTNADLQGVRVTLDGPNGSHQTATPTTDGGPAGTGAYMVFGLEPGNYLIRVDPVEYAGAGGPTTPTFVPMFWYNDYQESDPYPVTVANSDDGQSADFVLAPAHTISGTVQVQDPTSSGLLDGVTVSVHAGEFDHPVTTTVDPLTGHWAVGGLPGTSYKVEFSGDGLLTQWYNGAADKDSADWVEPWAGDVTGVDATMVTSRTLSGEVTLPGPAPTEWLSGVRVRLYDSTGFEATNTSVDLGTHRYSFTGLQPGVYKVRFEIQSYTADNDPFTLVTPNLVGEWYSDAASQATATAVDLTSGSRTNVNATLATGLAISGTATYPLGASDDIKHASYVYATDAASGYHQGSFDSSGTHFEIPGLAPGAYQVIFSSNDVLDPDTGDPVPTGLFASVAGEAPGTASKAVTLTSTGATVNVDYKAGHSISGRVTLNAPGHEDWLYGVYAQISTSTYTTGKLTVDPLTGDYVSPLLPPGDYRVEFGSQLAAIPVAPGYVLPSLIGEYYNNAKDASEATLVTLGTTNRTGINATLDEGRLLSGTVNLPGGLPEHAYEAIRVNATDSTGHTYTTSILEHGDYVFVGLPPSVYTVEFHAGTYYDGFDNVSTGLVSEYYVDAYDSADATPVDLTTSDRGDIDGSLELGASISGHIALPLGSPEAWYQGITVTAETDSHTYYGSVDTTGDYSITSFPAGDYRVHFTVGEYYDSDLSTVVTPDLAAVYYGGAPDSASASLVTATISGATGKNVTMPGGGQTFTLAPAPTIASATTYGNTLVATLGTWSPTPDQITYQWNRGGVPISGATDSLYTVTDADLGKVIDLTVTATRVGYVTVSKTSNTSQVAPASVFAFAPVPAISGARVLGGVLTAVPGAWSPTATTLTYQWQRNGAAIPGATKVTYTLTAADATKTITVKVTATKAGYATTTKTSTGIALPNFFTASPVPTISGTKAKGAVLTAKPGTWAPAATSFTYQWYRSGAALSGATKATYTLTASDSAKTITVKVTAAKAGYATTAKTSAGLTLPKFFTKTSAPTITGTLKSGSTLTAKVTAWSPKASGLTYQWYRSGTAISKATKTTYKLTTADRGKTITVKVTGTLKGYTTVTTTSAGKAIPKVFTTTPTPKVTGTLKSGKTLTAKAGTWKPKATKLTYQWYRNGKAITKATKTTYKLTASDKGKKITVKVTATKSGYLTTTKTSAAKTIAR